MADKIREAFMTAHEKSNANAIIFSQEISKTFMELNGIMLPLLS